MRPAILRDLQQLYDMHDAFKKQLESVSPQSIEAWLDGTPLRKSTILQKFQNQSLLTRRRVSFRMGREGADPSEALLIAKEIDKLVFEIFLMSFTFLTAIDYQVPSIRSFHQIIRCAFRRPHPSTTKPPSRWVLDRRYRSVAKVRTFNAKEEREP